MTAIPREHIVHELESKASTIPIQGCKSWHLLESASLLHYALHINVIKYLTHIKSVLFGKKTRVLINMSM